MNQANEPRNSGQEAPSGVEAGQGQGQGLERAKNGLGWEDRIRALADGLADTLIRKHRDYGRSGAASPVLAPWLSPFEALLCRKSDKAARIAQLARPGAVAQVKGEPLRDSLLDDAGYSLLAILALEDAATQTEARARVNISAAVPDLSEVDRYIRAVLASPHASEATKEGVRRRWPSFGAHFDEPQATGGNL